MGNCFGKESKTSDPFSQPGRTLGSAPPQSATTASIPSKAQAPKVTGPGHTLGSSGSTGDPREAAAKAAEARAQKKAGSGTLEAQLAAQKKKGMQGALQEASEENRRQRELDGGAEARAYN